MEQLSGGTAWSAQPGNEVGRGGVGLELVEAHFGQQDTMWRYGAVFHPCSDFFFLCCSKKEGVEERMEMFQGSAPGPEDAPCCVTCGHSQVRSQRCPADLLSIGLKCSPPPVKEQQTKSFSNATNLA